VTAFEPGLAEGVVVGKAPEGSGEGEADCARATEARAAAAAAIARGSRRSAIEEEGELLLRFRTCLAASATARVSRKRVARGGEAEEGKDTAFALPLTFCGGYRKDMGEATLSLSAHSPLLQNINFA
jgi:hypothetical protein